MGGNQAGGITRHREFARPAEVNEYLFGAAHGDAALGDIVINDTAEAKFSFISEGEPVPVGIGGTVVRKVTEFMHFIPVGNIIGIGVEGLLVVFGHDFFIDIHCLGNFAQSDALGVGLAYPVDFPVGKIISITETVKRGGIVG